MDWIGGIRQITRRLPVLGVVAFSLCSTYSIYQLLAGRAVHPTPLLWLPAVLIELVTAWSVMQIVGAVRMVTRSNVSKQDRRFYAIILVAFAVVALPLLLVSVWANAIEFGLLVLGLLFPLGSIGCAVGAALPDAMATYEQRRERERERVGKEKERRRKEKEREGKDKERARQQAASREQLLGNLGKAMETVRYFEGNPLATYGQAAESLGISPRTVGNHLAKAEDAGVIRRDGRGVEVLE